MPVWAKLTPSTTDIVVEARGAFLGGADAITSSNTFPSLPLIDPETLEFEMNVDGLVSSGGLGGPAILPLSLAKMAQLTQAFPDKSFSGIGGIAEFAHALNYFLLGCGTVQVCTAAMLDHAIGPNVIKGLLAGMTRRRWSGTAGRRSRTSAACAATASSTHSKIRRPDAKAYHGGYDDGGLRGSDATSRYWRPLDACAATRLRRADRGPLGQPALESRPRADAARAAHVVHLSHRRALDRHERGHHHLHARLRPDAAGHDLVAGDARRSCSATSSCSCR